MNASQKTGRKWSNANLFQKAPKMSFSFMRTHPDEPPLVAPAQTEYDPTCIQYRNLPISEWSSVPASDSVYSHYWSNPSEFEPSRFSENVSSRARCVDFGFAIAFLVNLVIAIGVSVFVIATHDPVDSPVVPVGGTEKVDIRGLFKVVAIGGVIALVSNVLHFFYMVARPRAYIESGMIIGLIFSGVAVIGPLITGSIGALIFPVICLALTCLWYCLVQHRIPFSALIFERALSLVRRYPSLLLLTAGLFVFQLGLAVAFGVVAVMAGGEHAGGLYFYLFFSYLWIQFTLNYIVYMTGAGVAARDYFMRGTEYMPQSPVLDSLRLALTTSLGSAACAALLLAVIRTLRAMLESSRANGDGENRHAGLEVVRCLAMCLLALLEGFARFMSRYALIYCAVWGVPYGEGCRRWCELECTKFIGVIIDGDIVGMSMGMNAVAVFIGTGLVAWAIGKGATNGLAGVVVAIAVVGGALIWALITQPVQVMVDTLFVCFAEDPERLRETDPATFESIEVIYRAGLSKRVGYGS
jgi:hypothetical protein